MNTHCPPPWQYPPGTPCACSLPCTQKMCQPSCPSSCRPADITRCAPYGEPVLITRVLAAGKKLPCTQCVELVFPELPCEGAPPWQVDSVQSNGAVCTMENCGCAEVTIPLLCCLKDCRGASWRLEASMQVTVEMNRFCASVEWGQKLVSACVRLVCPSQPSDTGRFTVQLEVKAEVYVVEYVCARATNTSPCACPPPAPLPMYPQYHNR